MFCRSLGVSLASLAMLIAVVPCDALAGEEATRSPNVVSRLMSKASGLMPKVLRSGKTRAQIGQLLRHRWKIKKQPTLAFETPRDKLAVYGIETAWNTLPRNIPSDAHVVDRGALASVMRHVAARDLRVLAANDKTSGVHTEGRFSRRGVSLWAIFDAFTALGVKPNRALKKSYRRHMEKRMKEAERALQGEGPSPWVDTLSAFDALRDTLDVRHLTDNVHARALTLKGVGVPPDRVRAIVAQILDRVSAFSARETSITSNDRKDLIVKLETLNRVIESAGLESSLLDRVVTERTSIERLSINPMGDFHIAARESLARNPLIN